MFFAGRCHGLRWSTCGDFNQPNKLVGRWLAWRPRRSRDWRWISKEPSEWAKPRPTNAGTSRNASQQQKPACRTGKPEHYKPEVPIRRGRGPGYVPPAPPAVEPAVAVKAARGREHEEGLPTSALESCSKQPPEKMVMVVHVAPYLRREELWAAPSPQGGGVFTAGRPLNRTGILVA